MQRVYGTAFFSKGELEQVPEPSRGSEEARPPQAGQGPRALPFPPVGAGRGVLAGQGHHRLPHHRQLHARRAAAERLRRAEDAAGVQQGAVGDVGPLAALPPEHVPHRQRRGADGHEGHELPRPHARLRQRDAELSRPAAALPRADAAAPQRGIRRAVGADPRPAVLAGRRALLRDGVADRRGGRAVAPASCSASMATSASTTASSCRRGRRSSSARSRPGITPRPS